MSEANTVVTSDQQVVNDDNLDDFSKDFFGQKDELPAEDQDAGSEQGSDEVDQTATTEQQTDAEDEAELEQEAAPRKKTVQDRIDEVVRQREDQKRESEAQMAQLRAEIEALKTPAKPVEQQAAKAEPDPNGVDASGELLYELGEFDPAYIRDLTRHMLQEERERMQEDAQKGQRETALRQEQAALQTTWNTKLEDATKTYPDFLEKGQALLANFNDLEPAYGSYLTQVLQTMDKGPEVLYYLSTHPEEAISIVNSGAQKATLALGRIESQFLQTPEAPRVKQSKAPPPPGVQSRGSNGAFIAVAPDTDDLDAFSSQFFSKKK